MTFDYGFADDEWLRPERPNGTLRAYRNHHAIADVLADPGGQDLTAHVNFSLLKQAGEQCGLRTEGLTTQAAFLTSALERTRQPTTRFGEWTDAHTRQFQTLTHPDQLGERFKLLLQTRECRG